jgi:hypothetical protein
MTTQDVKACYVNTHAQYTMNAMNAINAILVDNMHQRLDEDDGSWCVCVVNKVSMSSYDLSCNGVARIHLAESIPSMNNSSHMHMIRTDDTPLISPMRWAVDTCHSCNHTDNRLLDLHVHLR